MMSLNISSGNVIQTIIEFFSIEMSHILTSSEALLWTAEIGLWLTSKGLGLHIKNLFVE